MSERSQRLTGLARRLERAVPGGARVSLPADDQLVVSRNMLRGGFPRIGKWRRHVPRSGGYQVYVSCRLPTDQAAMDALSQRTTFGAPPARWDRHTMRLRAAESELNPQWRVLNGRTEVVTVLVVCGSAQVLDEVNRILAEIEAVLLA
ncbi:hypothetical protein [Rugosimonospora africana]|uniref:Uncharacterized protein n=1 Tax=Rugosimonospora africana TaxID=556532 RepID=A0A8J3QPN2_9ACTN|nr:hypothetical protein [Rugosimonospora africana]GIH14149.1 hypothetical protein Raf01_23210 [Rugosimonospora africana]